MPRSGTRLVVRPAPPTLRRRTPKAEERHTAESPAPAKAEVRKTKPKTVLVAQRRAESPPKISNAPALARVPAARPSYNCRYARTRSEVAVCSDAGLASLDQQMAAQFNTTYRQGTPDQRQVLERSRLRFLYRRDRCRSASCIAEIYRTRMNEINDIAARHWQDP